MKWLVRFGWMATGVAALYGLTILAKVASGGSLDPPGSPASTMKSLADLVPAWHQTLNSNGCGSARWTCVLNNEAVLDNETGLVWQRTPMSNDGLPWYDARSTCESSSAGGRLGWRLPTSSEILTLIDANTGNLFASHPFNNVTGTSFWTLTSDVADTASAETVGIGGFFGGQHGYFDKNGAGGGAWCVRGQTGFDPAPPEEVSSWWRQLLANNGPDSCHSSRFQCVLSNEAVLDRMTGLVWQRNVGLFTSGYTQPNAAANCANALIGGIRGWRLPTIGELTSLQDPAESNPSLPSGHPFQNLPGLTSSFWSSTVVPGGGGSGFVGFFFNISAPFSGAFSSASSGFYNSWCVRGAG